MAKCDCQTGFFPYARLENFEGEGKKTGNDWKLGFVLK